MSATCMSAARTWWRSATSPAVAPEAGEITLNFENTDIREVVKVVQGILPPGALFARLGGEEFLAILYPANEETAVQVMERARRACARRPVAIDSGEIDVTVSLGAAVVRDYEGVDLPTILKTADRALYQAKNDGRNRSVFEVV